MYIFIYIYAQNRCLAVGWNCLKLGVLSWFLEISNGKMWRNAIWPHVSFFFLCFTTSSVALLPWRRLMEIVLLSLPSNLFYRQSLRSGLLSVLAADASLRRQAPEYFSGFFSKCFSQERSVAAVFAWCNQVCFQLSDHWRVNITTKKVKSVTSLTC